MSFWRTFHSIHEDLVFVLGFSLNVLLLIVIKTIKIKSLQKYNILLLQCCCVDLLQILITFIVKPITILHHRNLYYLSNGFLRPIGGQIEMIGILLWITSVCFCVCSMPISFIFRYRILCLNATISKKFYIISLIVAFLSASTLGITVWNFQYIDNGHLTYLTEGFSWLLGEKEDKVKATASCSVVSFKIIQKFSEINIEQKLLETRFFYRSTIF